MQVGQLRLNYLNQYGNLEARLLRNCDLFTNEDVRKAAQNAKFMFLKEHPEAETNGRNLFRQMCDWLLSPVSPDYKSRMIKEIE